MLPLTLDSFKSLVGAYVTTISGTPIPQLYGVTDGKAIGTFIEHSLTVYLGERSTFERGSAAHGIDFPSLNVDLKVTSARQPQSSCPFHSAEQKVYGLGYHLVVLVYDKLDDALQQTSTLEISHAIFIDQHHTSDYQTTAGLHQLLTNDANVDDIDAFLEERHLPLDEIGRRVLAERIISHPPEQGYLTISNALQWRLQYARALTLQGQVEGIETLR